MDEMEELVPRLILFAVLGVLAWIFLPRTFYYGDNIMLYPVEIKHCNEYGVCDVAQFFPPLKLRVDVVKSEVVWMNTGNGFVGSWKDCTIADKENWTCTAPPLTMNAGNMTSDQPELRYMSGWSYRLHWLGSFLPDLRKKQ